MSLLVFDVGLVSLSAIVKLFAKRSLLLSTASPTVWLEVTAMRRGRPLWLTVLVALIFIVFMFRPWVPAIQSFPITPHGSVLEGLRNASRAEIEFQAPLSTRGRNIIDRNGKRVKLASINWYGASDIYFVPGGLDLRHRDEIAATIREMGFNSVRFPYSDQMVIDNPIVASEHIAANLDLLGSKLQTQHPNTMDDASMRSVRALDVFHACVKAMTDAGLAVIVNNHITNAHWCDGKNLCDASWKNDHYGPICSVRQTTDSWIDNWLTIMTPHVHNPLVVGADLRNEPRGLWGLMTWDMLASASEEAITALQQLNPDWLMLVEGVSSSNDISGAKRRPIRSSVADRVVYSSHVYAWSGWSTLVPYSRRRYDSFARDMTNNWGYLLREDIAPVWVGEFGAPGGADGGDRNYWDNLMMYLHETDADFAYWALNPRKPENNEFESYGLLRDDWITVVEDYRMDDLRRLMSARSSAS